jgi:hypothetical protein
MIELTLNKTKREITYMFKLIGIKSILRSSQYHIPKWIFGLLVFLPKSGTTWSNSQEWAFISTLGLLRRPYYVVTRGHDVVSFSLNSVRLLLVIAGPCIATYHCRGVAYKMCVTW